MEDNLNKGIQKIFSELPRTYELTNHILTLGLDILWRRKAARAITFENDAKCLDVCSGTGEMAKVLRRLSNGRTVIIASDFCLPMLKEALKKPASKKIHFCVSSADSLPFPDNTFDVVTISFGTRNINTNQRNLLNSFREFYRILKPGGKFFNLETSQPKFILIRKLFHLYVRLFVKPIGYMLSGSKAAYSYLSYTIPRFFRAGELSSILYKAGFKKVNFYYLTFGISAVHMGVK